MSVLGTDAVSRFQDWLLSIGEHPGETVEERGRRRIIVGAFGYSLPFVALSVLVATGAGHAVANAAKVLAHAGGLVFIARFPLRYGPALRIMFAVDFLVDLAITFMLGGLYLSGFQLGWSLIVVLGALVALPVREAAYWFGAFVVMVLLAASPVAQEDPLYEMAAPETSAAFTISAAMFLAFLVMSYFVRQRDRLQRESDDLLHNILPDEVAVRLKRSSAMIADDFDAVTVLFADVVDFTPMSAGMAPAELVGLLDDVFGDVDDMVDELGLEKIKTVGDEYMVAAGVPVPRDDHAHAVADLALRIQQLVASKDYRGRPITFRIGVHSGPVVAGIIGRRKFAYDLWGDVVNIASRMESHGVPGRIQISANTRQLIEDRFECQPRGEVEVKGKGTLETWFLVGTKESS